eukprot:TRINITY_DN6619_c0_g1_i1.p1 TRINITY_DN6619_c0_g1~~TRINITY_DN6619_c0_g1_i1.p1  ORF type:complete len:224 (+),score=37.83 TRINITY_DN6619_c0_g1_i1:321-992(+)
MNTQLNGIRNRLGLPSKKMDDFRLVTSDMELANFKSQCEAIWKAFKEQKQIKGKIFSFTFGIPDDDTLHQFRDRDFVTMGTATSLKEALELSKRPIDIIVLQGSEAGGHRGNFIEFSDSEKSSVPPSSFQSSIDLLKEVIVHIKKPLIVAGIRSPSDVTLMLREGSQGVSMGTAFITCEESGAPPSYKKTFIGISTKFRSVFGEFHERFHWEIRSCHTKRICR